MTEREARGYIDAAPLSGLLPAHVTEPGDDPHIRGHDVDDDLARHYGALATAYLALPSDLPDAEQLRLLNAAMVLAAPMHAGEGPSRSASLSAVTSTDPYTSLKVGWLALVDRTAAELEDRRALLRALLDDDEQALRAACAEGAPAALSPRFVEDFTASCPALHLVREPLSAAIALMIRAGLRDELALVNFICSARIAVVLAEAKENLASGLRNYPTNTPPFRYYGDATHEQD
jgi:hypothetical protein